MWDELTPIPTVNVSLRFIATYAGFQDKSDLLWDLYLKGVSTDEHEDGKGTRVPGFEDLPVYENGSLFVYWDHENRMPWQTEKYLEDQFLNEKPNVYLRFHENRWVSSKDTFVPAAWYERAVEKGIELGISRSVRLWPEHPMRKLPVFVAIDASYKRDSTSVTAVAYDLEAGLIYELDHEIWLPEYVKEEEGFFDLWETVGEYVLGLSKILNIELVVYDPTQMHQVATMLAKEGITIQEYEQTVPNMKAASQSLYDVLQTNSFVTFEDDRARQQIKKAVAEATGNGFRIVKYKADARSAKIDWVIALAMAIHQALLAGGYESKEDLIIRSSFPDQTQLPPPLPPGEENLPWMFRSK
jgi:phage terminase large subunit-like protein